MAEIVWTDEAVYWFEEIYNYISIDNPAAAQRTVDGIFKKVQILSKFPEIGYIHDKDFNHNIRVLLYGHYRIAYLVKNKSRVEILGIYHGSLDIERFLYR